MAGIRGLPISTKEREGGRERDRERGSQFFDIDFLKGSIIMIRFRTDSRIEYPQVSQSLFTKKIVPSPDYVSILCSLTMQCRIACHQ